jgi:acyl-CoA hydrolase
MGEDPFAGLEISEHLRHNSLFVGSADRQAVAAGRSPTTPRAPHDIPRLFSSGRLPLDAVLIQTSPPDEHGFLSLGVECLATMAAISAAAKLIVEINPPDAADAGGLLRPPLRVTKLIEVDHPLTELPRHGFTDVERRIGAHVAGLVEDGATLQLGIGGIPDAILSFLGDRRDLGVHTEMISDGILTWWRRGWSPGPGKSLHKGKVGGDVRPGHAAALRLTSTTTPMFELAPLRLHEQPLRDLQQRQHGGRELGQSRWTSRARLCADSIGTRIFSGFGGQLDFVRGARRSKNGKAIIALPSTAKEGKVSRIVPLLQPGAGVVTTRADVQYVGHGARGGQTSSGAPCGAPEALIGLAHPDFREELQEAARERDGSSRPGPLSSRSH